MLTPKKSAIFSSRSAEGFPLTICVSEPFVFAPKCDNKSLAFFFCVTSNSLIIVPLYIFRVLFREY